MTLADRLVVMNEGRIEQVGAPAEVYRRPVQPLCRRLHRLAGNELLRGARGRSRTRRVWREAPLWACREHANLPPAGNALMLGVRPEEMQITDASGERRLSVRCRDDRGARRRSSPLRPARRTDCVVATPSAVAPCPAREMFVRILAESVHIFSAETGSRIDAMN